MLSFHGYQPPTSGKYVGLRVEFSGRELRAQDEPCDLLGSRGPTRDQGPAGTCVPFAVIGAADVLDQRASRPVRRWSERAFYWWARELRGTLGHDSGVSLQQGIEVGRTRGFVPAEFLPYDPYALEEEPSADAYIAAQRRRIVNAEALSHDGPTIRSRLRMGYPVVVGVSVFRSWDSAPSRAGKVPMPTRDEERLGGHALTLLGWTPTGYNGRPTYYAQTHYGPLFGLDGIVEIPGPYIEDIYLCHELYAVMAVADETVPSDLG